MMKTYEIFKLVYEDICNDAWYGKGSRKTTIGYVVDTEENVKALVDEINEKRNSHYYSPITDEDADYIAYKEYGNVKISTFDEIKNHYECTRRFPKW